MNYTSNMTNIKQCDTCSNQDGIRYKIIDGLLNDPVIEICQQCYNNYLVSSTTKYINLTKGIIE